MQSTDKYLVVTHPVLLSQPPLSKFIGTIAAIWLLYEIILFKSSKGYLSYPSDPSVFQLCVTEGAQNMFPLCILYSVGFTTSICIFF